MHNILYINRFDILSAQSSIYVSFCAPYLENIKAERRFELAFEGVRYYDLLRWHDEDLITINQTGIVTYNRRGQANAETKSITFRKETGGFLPIPQTQIDLSGGVLTQNTGWEGGDIYLN